MNPFSPFYFKSDKYSINYMEEMIRTMQRRLDEDLRRAELHKIPVYNVTPIHWLNGTDRAFKIGYDIYIAEEHYYKFLFSDGVTKEALKKACDHAKELMNNWIDYYVKVKKELYP